MLVDAPQYIVARNRNRRAAVRRGKKRQPALRDTAARSVNRRTQYVMGKKR